MIRTFSVLLGIFGLITGQVFAGTMYDDMEIELTAEQPHQFVFSNKKAAFWFGETQQPNGNAFQGYTVLEQRYLADYFLTENGEEVDRTTAQRIVLYPDRLEREYAHFKEIFHFVDSLNMLLIEIVPNRPLKMGAFFQFVDPILSGEWEWQKDRQSYRTIFTGFGIDKPSFIAVTASGDVRDLSPGRAEVKRSSGETIAGLGLDFRLTGRTFVALCLAQNQPELQRILELVKNPEQVLGIRRQRIEKLLSKNRLVTGNSQLNRAYRWALISLNDLVTEQRGKGIWAGLPWFNNYWGRDSFISFTGALLCSGQFSEAREVLRSFARFQDQNPASPYFGRIPNRVTLKEIIYNTADGTPWFVKACENYLQYSGDAEFMEEFFPVIYRATEGALKNYADEHGFLTHGDAETWMDAVGSEGPWSPRGNRAVEIQALWLEQLRISRQWAGEMGFDHLSRKLAALENKVRQNFAKFYWCGEKGYLYDHLNTDGSPDNQLRPNQIFALTLPARPLLDSRKKEKVIRTVTEKLTYPWGVGSLWQGDPNFHPYHHYEPYYVPDAAYHNGIVWTWLAGPLLSALFPVNSGLAYNLLENEAWQILHLNALGSYSELLEAWPREGTDFPQISGTVSQAWNLAEFIRNIREDMLGVRPANGDTLRLEPHLPPDISRALFSFRYKDAVIRGRYQTGENEFSILLQPEQKSSRGTVLAADIPLPGGKHLLIHQAWTMNEQVEINISSSDKKPRVTVNGTAIELFKISEISQLTGLKFCQPEMGRKLPALQGPAYELLPPEEVVRRPGRFTRVLFDVTDPAGDDRGPNGKYVYPTHPAFEQGIFDGRKVKIWRDKNYFYFRIKLSNLVDPGWHPESGFQLTYLAIALNFGDQEGVRRTRVGMSAHFSVPPEFAYNYIIFVGNGYRIMDSRGEVVAEYRPVDRNHPLGDVRKKTVQFSVPARYFPETGLRTAYVMIGGQDDHGGGGLGEFRRVGKTANEWQGGGGKSEQENPAVYDVIEVR